MKLIRAEFKNFRLLRDVEINFSTDKDKKLTVIRADNGTGKTTAMNGLIWGLYGSEFIGEKLYPMSLVDEEIFDAEIQVIIEFSTEDIIQIGGKALANEKVYRLIRTCKERVFNNNADYERSNDQLDLYERTDEGFIPILIKSEIRLIIERALPSHLKDIYFTDGDKALTFIESAATSREKRLRVQKAIESLLSMKDLESLIKLLKNVEINYLGKIDKNDYSKLLLEAETEIQRLEDWIETTNVEVSSLLNEKKQDEEKLAKIEKEIEEQLKLGNKDLLANEIREIKKQIESALVLKNNSIKSLCAFLNDKTISSSLISEKLKPAINLLKDMKARDNFPKQFIPVLNDILKRDTCLCGADLDSKNGNGLSKREYIAGVIEDCREVDEINARASGLYFSSDDYLPISRSFSERYGQYSLDYFSAGNNLKTSQLRLKEKQNIIDGINDDMLVSLRQHAKTLKNKIFELGSDISVSQNENTRHKEKVERLKIEAEKHAGKLNKNNTAGGKHELSRALSSIFCNVFESIKTSELSKVSYEMNRIFLSMIGADGDLNNNGMIKRAALSPDFDIKVFGPGDQPMNPDTELNGASRRAISLAFILALTKVSKVNATNVIDTPLGMTSGLVKSSLLENLVKEGSQIVMFLTYDEIKGVEDLLDKYSGSNCTLSFSGHYPKMLRHKPVINGVTTACNCNHRQFCQKCERLDQVNLSRRIEL